MFRATFGRSERRFFNSLSTAVVRSEALTSGSAFLIESEIENSNLALLRSVHDCINELLRIHSALNARQQHDTDVVEWASRNFLPPPSNARRLSRDYFRN